MLSGDSTHCGARATVLTVVLDEGRHQSATAGPHSSKHTHTHIQEQRNTHGGFQNQEHEHTLSLKRDIYTHAGWFSPKNMFILECSHYGHKNTHFFHVKCEAFVKSLR